MNAHGTSTEFDYVEAQAVAEMFGAETPVTSCKGAIGHLLGAAGAVEAIAALESVRRGAIPPTVGLEELDERIPNDIVAGSAREAPDLKVALSNSFGFGGQNACVVVAQ